VKKRSADRVKEPQYTPRRMNSNDSRPWAALFRVEAGNEVEVEAEAEGAYDVGFCCG
jgi:hypothetical protein